MSGATLGATASSVPDASKTERKQFISITPQVGEIRMLIGRDCTFNESFQGLRSQVSGYFWYLLTKAASTLWQALHNNKYKIIVYKIIVWFPKR